MDTEKSHKLKNKKVLITAGPTWVPIDNVRVISNIATGETGILLAEKLQKLGAKVTLLLGPVSSCCLSRNIKLIRFKFFGDLKEKVKQELRSRKYDIIIHSAAVSDFRPRLLAKGKIESEKIYNLKLSPVPKIISDIKRLAPQVKLMMFKLESGINDKILIKRTKQALINYQADMAVGNTIHPKYKAFILDRNKVYYKVHSKKELIHRIVSLLENY